MSEGRGKGVKAVGEVGGQSASNDIVTCEPGTIQFWEPRNAEQSLITEQG